MLDPDKTIILHDSVLLKVMPRAKIITDLCIKEFDSFAELEAYMDNIGIQWRGEILGHEMGQLTNITFPRGSHYGAVSRKQGCTLNSIWEECSDDYGIFVTRYEKRDHLG